MSRRVLCPVLALLAAAALISACAGKGGDAPAKGDFSSRKIRVVTTIGMITDIVEGIGGDRVEAKGLMGPGVDPHLYKASEGDVTTMARADVVFYCGLHLEGKMAEVFERMKGRTRTEAVTDGIDRKLILEIPGYPGNYDPHVWFDVTLWMKAAERVRDVLIDMDPRHADGYRARAKDYLARLADADEYVRQRTAKVPPNKRVLITAHDAFQYFGRAYGFEVKGLQGVSTVTEAGTADIQNLAAFIVERKIPAVFVESSVPPRYVEALREAVRARGFDVKMGGSLFSDAMGNPGTPEGTYVGMVRHNVDTIARGLEK